jgi:hypothetical protein
MDMQASVLCRGSVIALTIVVMSEAFLVVRIVIMMMIERMQCEGVDRVTGIIVMLMSVRRGSRDEAIARKGKREAEAQKASDARHDFRLEANCCSLLKLVC